MSHTNAHLNGTTRHDRGLQDFDTRLVRRVVREAVGAHTNTPVRIVAGDRAPRIVGRSYYWTTPSGKTEVQHPNAYGWPVLYHASTRRVQVGAGWVASRFSAAELAAK